MRYYKQIQNNLAAGVTFFLAVIFITACTNTPPSQPTEIAATAVPTDTATPIPATATATPSPSRTPTPHPPTSTVTPTPTPTPSATRTPIPPTFTPIPTPQPGPKPTLIIQAPAAESVEVYETTITIPTYPIKEYLTEQIDPVYNIPVFYFNRADYEAQNPTPTPVAYSGVVLENPYLRLTFIPELGGRLYSAVIKETDQEVFYHNPVVKASRYGILDPYEANWWLGTGGMEWAYPTQEHGYRFGVPWEYSVSRESDGVTITLSDTAPDRIGLMVDVTLPADSATFTVAPTLINNGPAEAPVQLWINAALALTPGSMSPRTQFVVPTEVITIHSRGEAGWTVPGEKEQSPWPQVGETDLRDYGQWANYLGFFCPRPNRPLHSGLQSGH